MVDTYRLDKFIEGHSLAEQQRLAIQHLWAETQPTAPAMTMALVSICNARLIAQQLFKSREQQGGQPRM